MHVQHIQRNENIGQRVGKNATCGAKTAESAQNSGFGAIRSRLRFIAAIAVMVVCTIYAWQQPSSVIAVNAAIADQQAMLASQHGYKADIIEDIIEIIEELINPTGGSDNDGGSNP